MRVRLRAFLLPVGTTLIGALVVPHTLQARPIAYVASRDAGALTELDTVRNAVAATIPLSLGFERRHARVSPNGKRLYISGPDTLSVIDVGTNQVLDTLQRQYCNAQGCSLGDFDLSPDGGVLYLSRIAGAGSPLGDAISVINTATDREVASIPVGPDQHPGAVATAADGTLYVALESSRSIARIDGGAHAVSATIPLSGLPLVLAVSPDGRYVYAGTWARPGAPLSDSAVEVVDVSRGAVIASLPVPPVPQGIAPTPDGHWVYVASTSGVVTAIDTATNEIGATIPAPGAQRLVLAPDGSMAYVSDYDSGHVLVIDTRAQRVVAAIPTGPIPLALAVSPGGERLYAVTPWPSAPAAVSVIDTAAMEVVTTIPDAYRFDSVVLRPDGRFAYLTTDVPKPGAVVVDTAANRPIATIALSNPTLAPLRAAVAPDGHVLYVTTEPLTAIDTATNTVVTTIPLAGVRYPVSLGFAPDGRHAYVLGYTAAAVGGPSPYSASVAVVDVAAAAWLETHALPADGTPAHLAVTPNGLEMYVSLRPPVVSQFEPPRPGAIAIVDLQTFQVVQTFPYSSERVVFSPDGRVAYAATSSDGIAVIDTGTRAITAWVDPGFAPEAIALRPDGALLYATGFGSEVAVVDTRQARLVASIFVGGLTGDVVAGETADVACRGDCNGDDAVAIEELIRGVSIMLGLQLPGSCRNLATHPSGAVQVDELIQAVASAMDGCAAASRTGQQR